MKFLTKAIISFEKVRTSTLIWGIIVIGFILYFRMFFNGFVADDAGYILHPYIKNFEILKFFQSSSADLGGTSPITGQFFRPMMLVVISCIHLLADDNAFLYHLVQLSFHIVNVLLVFFLFKHFFSRTIAYLLALIYLVHPINVESVAYISDFQDILFVFFGLSSLVLILSAPFNRKTFITISLLLLFSLLSKETGILFFPCLILLVYWMRPTYKKVLPVICLAPLLLYSFIRVFVASVWAGHVPHTVFGSLPLSERLIQIPSILSYYITTFFYPSSLAFGQTWTVVPSFQTVALPLIGIVAFLIIISMYLLYLRQRNVDRFWVMLFFSSWFVLGLLIHVQLLPLEMTVADRWFYFPCVGILGLIGILMTSLPRYARRLICMLIIISVPLLLVRSYTRLGDWKDSYTLYKHDRAITESYLVEGAYGYELMQRNEMKSAYAPIKKSVDLLETSNNTNTLGVYYFKMNNLPQAIHWMSRSTELGDNFLAYSNLSRILLAEKSYPEAQQVLEKATKKFPKNDGLWYLLALTYYQQGDTIGALTASEQAYSLAHTQANSYIYNQLRAGLPIIITE